MVSGNSELKPRVAYLGPIASYSHQATMGCFSADKYQYEPCPHIKDIFDAVQTGACVRGIIPFENSTNGPVVFTLDLLADRESVYPDITVSAETYVDVHHYLLGNFPPNHSTPTPSSQFENEALDSGTCTPTTRDPNPLQPRTKPICSLSHIKKLFSHPQAFGQCEIFLQTYLKGVERIDVSSTSRAAEIAKEDITGRSAAISSKAAHEVHKVDVLAKGIEDKTDNCTRFLIIKRRDSEHSPTGEPQIDGTVMKSLVSFTVNHRSPGALAEVLGCFSRYGLNLTSINSRPSKLVPFQYIFFVEFEEARVGNDDEGQVQKALEDVGKVATNCRLLGTWMDRLSSRSRD